MRRYLLTVATKAAKGWLERSWQAGRDDRSHRDSNVAICHAYTGGGTWN